MMEGVCPDSAARPMPNAPELEPIDVAEPSITTPVEAGGCQHGAGRDEADTNLDSVGVVPLETTFADKARPD